MLASKPGIALGCPVLCKAIKAQVIVFHNGQCLLGVHNYITIVGLVITLAECTCWLLFLLIITDVGPLICMCVKLGCGVWEAIMHASFPLYC